MTRMKKLMAPTLIAMLAMTVSSGRLVAQGEDPGVGERGDGKPYFSQGDHNHDRGERSHRGPHREGPGGFDHKGRRGGPMGFGEPDGPGAPGARMMMALRELDLSESQRIEIKTIFEQDRSEGEAYREAMRALGAELEAQIESDPFDEDSVRAKAAAVAAQGVEIAVLRARQAGRVRSLLTPEQLDRLKQMKTERTAFREERRERFERRRGPRAGS